MMHCSSEQLHAYVDGRLSDEEREFVIGHVRVCPDCSRAYHAVKMLDGSLRRISLDTVRAGFTQAVMERLALTPKSPFLFRLLENAAYILGLIFVLSVMIVAFVLSGVLDTGQISQTQGVVSQAWSVVGERLSGFVGSFADTLQRFLPFIFGNGNASLTGFGLIVVLVLAALDWLVRKRPASD